MTTLSPTSYNRYSRYLHWLIAGLILFMVFLGWRLGDHDSMRYSRVQLHKSVGIAILFLSLLRLGVRLAYKAPPEPPMPKWQAWVAKALHIGFYVVMIGMPLTGWAMVSTSAREIPILGNIVHLSFGWPHLPFIPVDGASSHDVHEVFETIHGLIAKLLIYAMIPLHVAAALKHHFVDKDEVIEHMVPGLTPEPVANWRWIVPLGVVGIATALALGIYRGVPDAKEPPAPPEAAASVAPVEAPASVSAVSEATSSSAEAAAVPTWIVDKSATKIAFATTFSGEAINGGFSSYSASITFDPEQLDKSRVKVTIDLTSVSSGDNDRDSTLKSDSFFNVAGTPKAVFEASSFTKKDATHFVARGKLTLHGTTKPLDLPFSLNIKNGVATMAGTVNLDRTAYGVGSGEWAATDSIPAKVAVTINLKAKASK